MKCFTCGVDKQVKNNNGKRVYNCPGCKHKFRVPDRVHTKPPQTNITFIISLIKKERPCAPR